MEQFIAKFGKQIEGVLSGFDRLVFRGSLRSLSSRHWDAGLKAMVATGMEQYLWRNGILFKDYERHVKKVSVGIREEARKQYERRKLPVMYLSSGKEDKEAIARRAGTERNIRSGPVCLLSCA